MAFGFLCHEFQSIGFTMHALALHAFVEVLSAFAGGA